MNDKLKFIETLEKYEQLQDELLDIIITLEAVESSDTPTALVNTAIHALNDIKDYHEEATKRINKEILAGRAKND